MTHKRDDNHAYKLKDLNKSFKLSHLNSQLIISQFHEFQVLLKERPFDVITLSETRLKNNKYILDYAITPDYSFLYHNKNKQKGGGVGVYIKENIKFKEGKDY